MKAFLKLALFVFSVTYLTPVMADMQSPNQSRKETFVDISRVRVSGEGLSLKNHQNEWMIVKGLPQNLNETQIGGILNLIFPDRNYIAKCNNCGMEYINRAPQPCESCKLNKGMDLTYQQEGYWE